MEAVTDRHLRRHRRQMRLFFPRNYVANCIEGGLFSGGIAFTSPAIVLPVLLHSLAGPAWLIALSPNFITIGWLLAPMLTAHLLERLTWLKPAILLTGAFQRSAYLLAGLMLIFLAGEHPWLGLVALASAPLICGFFAGLTGPAWLELVAKSIPTNRLSSTWAIRNLIAAAIGLAAGAVVKLILGLQLGTSGYGFLHLFTFVLMVGSYISFLFVREPQLPARPASHAPSLLRSWAAMPGLVTADARFARYLVSRVLTYGGLIVVPFLSLHALAVLGDDEKSIGTLLSLQMAGGILGNLLAGHLGDRIGAGRITRAGELAFAGVLAWSALAGARWEFSAIFFLFGLTQMFGIVGRGTLDIEVCPLNRRPTYLAILSGVGLVSMLLASLAAWLLTGHYLLQALLAAACVAAGAIALVSRPCRG